MEIKTAEQYVVNRLIETEEELENTKDDLTTLNYNYQGIRMKYLELKDRVRKICHITGDNADRRIRFDSYIWETYDKKDFDYWTNVFPDLLDSNDENESEEQE